MKTKLIIIASVILFIAIAYSTFSYPPAVGVVGKSKSCLSCHTNKGPWADDDKTIIDILDKETMQSLRQSDGIFLIEAYRGKQKTVLTVIGRINDDSIPAPYRNAWIYIDPMKIGSDELSKFATGWDVNLPISCRLVGDKLTGYENVTITALPMTIQPNADAKDSEILLQVMLTKGESVKGKAKEGMLGNYFERKVKLIVIE